MHHFLNVAHHNMKVKSYDDVYAAYQIPYAHDNGRFKVATPLTLEDLPEELDCSVRGPVFPQNPNRLSKVMGKVEAEKYQSESAFHLNIFSKETFDQKPVLFWIHGGGWLTGGGALPWYDGHELVAQHDVVVVTINYRIGALGAFYQDDASTYNFGMNDIIQALKWTYEHIKHFGGDPERITVGGQSAGAWYSVALLGLPDFSRYASRVLLHSFPGNVSPLDKTQGHQLASRFKPLLQDEDLTTVNIEKLLQAQGKLMKEIVDTSYAIIPTSFIPIHDHLNSTEDFIQQAVHASAGKVDIKAYVTEDETTAFLNGDNDVRAILSTMKSEFMKPTLTLLEQFQQHGSRTQFDVIKGGNHQFGATHCFDLPLLFGNFQSWSNAPMLDNIDWKAYTTQSKAVQKAVVEWMN